jgi:hypothetical protein
MGSARAAAPGRQSIKWTEDTAPEGWKGLVGSLLRWGVSSATMAAADSAEIMAAAAAAAARATTARGTISAEQIW